MVYNIVVFGDSIAQGAFDGECGGWVNRLTAFTFQQTIDSGFSDQSLIYNRGISADGIADLEKRYECELVSCTALGEETAIIFAIGKNDAAITVASGKTAIPIDQFRSALIGLVQDAKRRGVFVACVGLGSVDEAKTNPIVWDPTTALRNADLREFDSVIAEVATSENIVYIPVADIFEGKPELVPDGLHPNASGHQLIFERVKKYLKEAGVI